MTLETSRRIIGQSPKILEILRTSDLVAGTDVPVLIAGKTGTGKDLFALRVHQQSQRKKRAFIKISCSSLLDKNAGELLFGSKGYIAQARSGTLFLDEVSELAPALQTKLLHFIETSEIINSGEKVAKKYDVRIIATSCKDLQNEVDQGTFRAELFYRLNVIPVELPPLKDRDDDVALLMDYFFRKCVREQHQTPPTFTKAALKQLSRYEWPGNIRELHNFCERMFILFSGKTVDVTNLPHEFGQYTQSKDSPFSLPAAGIQLEQLEVDFIQQALQTTGGNKSKAARLLGLTRDTFLYRLKKYSIDF